jgi:hypothetical protein
VVGQHLPNHLRFIVKCKILFYFGCILLNSNKFLLINIFFFMKHQFTTHHLIGYIYNELSYMELVAMEKALKEDAALAAKLAILKESHKALEELQLEPSKLSIQNILNYSKSSRYEANVM